jgi:hypothetical protein
MHRPPTLMLALIALAASISSAVAAEVKIDFEDAGLGFLFEPAVPIPGATYLDYRPAPGVTFAGTGFAAVDADSPEGFPGSGDFARALTPIGAMTMYRDSSSTLGSIINVESGFVGTVSFRFSTILSSKSSVKVFSEADGGGVELGTTMEDDLPALGSDLPPFPGPWGRPETGNFNIWRSFTLSFAGVGKSIVFNGDSLPPTGNGAFAAVFFDDITLTPVPEPATYVLMLGGVAALGMAARRKLAA